MDGTDNKRIYAKLYTRPKEVKKNIQSPWVQRKTIRKQIKICDPIAKTKTTNS